MREKVLQQMTCKYSFNLDTVKSEKIKRKNYYTDVTKAHEVHNMWEQDRLHLVIDCYSNQTMRELILQ
jgi:aspartyl/asparaginyl beta-hydroxylase (cupin superfamily)